MIGIDFGTTNSGAALYDSNSIKLLPLDPSAGNPVVCRSAVYITRGREYFLGSQALNLYFEQNIGRPSRYRKIWVGEIKQVFAELPVFFRDVYVFEDEFSPGRLFLSIKTVLRDPKFLGTVFQNQWYTASDLAAVYLTGLKIRAESYLGTKLDAVVLGRPVHFSSDEIEDRVAQSRLLHAAFKAGFERVHLLQEPVAAALSYEHSLTQPEVVLVFDFGGGTLDFTIMEVGRGEGKQKILATGGIPVAGDIFDQRLFRATIPKHLGEGDYYTQYGRRYPIPAHIFDLLKNPQEIVSLNTPQNQEMLRTIHLGARNKKKTAALLEIVSSNYALMLFDVIEKIKCQLSVVTETDLSVVTDNFSISDTVTRLRFEIAIHSEFEAVRAELLDTLKQAGVVPKDIDKVVRTGGSSQIPLFKMMLDNLFGKEKIHDISFFSSVTSGLGLHAFMIEKGITESETWTPDKLQAQESIQETGNTSIQSESPSIQQVDLSSVREHLRIVSDFESGTAGLPDVIGIHLGEDRLEAYVPGETRTGQDPDQLSWVKKSWAGKNDLSILTATDTYKLQAVSLDKLYKASMGMGFQATDLIHLDTIEDPAAGFEPYQEFITTIAVLNIAAPEKRFLTLVTNTGQMRSFESRLLADQIRPRPYFQLEKRYTGLPFSLSPTSENDQVLAGTTKGRIARAVVRHSQAVTWEIVRARKEELVCGSGVISTTNQGNDVYVLAISSDGNGIRFKLGDIPTEGPPASRGVTLHRNFNSITFIDFDQAANNQFRLLTNTGRSLRICGLDSINNGKVFPISPPLAIGEKISGIYQIQE